MNSLIESNIKNLTTLWKTAGEKHNAFFSFPDFEYSLAQYGQWPNRLWFTDKIN